MSWQEPIGSFIRQAASNTFSPEITQVPHRADFLPPEQSAQYVMDQRQRDQRQIDDNENEIMELQAAQSARDKRAATNAPGQNNWIYYLMGGAVGFATGCELFRKRA